MTIGEFIESLPQKHTLSEDERVSLTIGIYFAKAKDKYGISLICFMDPRAVSRFTRTLRKAGYRGVIPLSP